VLEIEPARYFVRVIKREKLACHKCPEGGVVTAAAGAPRSWKRASSPTLWIVDVLIKKYHTLRTGIEMPIYFEPHTFRPLDMSSFGPSRGWPIKASISMFGGRV
jgi:hypothetical protein